MEWATLITDGATAATMAGAIQVTGVADGAIQATTGVAAGVIQDIGVAATTATTTTTILTEEEVLQRIMETEIIPATETTLQIEVSQTTETTLPTEVTVTPQTEIILQIDHLLMGIPILEEVQILPIIEEQAAQLLQIEEPTLIV